jgi:hypothetical protein
VKAGFLPICALFAVLPLAGGCGSRGDVIKGEVQQKIARPGGGAVAVVTLAEGGATVSNAYHVYLQNPANPDQTADVLHYDKGPAPVVSWAGTKGLLLKVDCGQIYNFTNFAFFWPAEQV